MALSGISFVTTLPAPITVLFPIFTPGNIVTCPPIHNFLLSFHSKLKIQHYY